MTLNLRTEYIDDRGTHLCFVIWPPENKSFTCRKLLALIVENKMYTAGVVALPLRKQ